MFQSFHFKFFGILQNQTVTNKTSIVETAVSQRIWLPNNISFLYFLFQVVCSQLCL